MAGPHSGPYLSADPQKSQEQIDAEAALAYAKLRAGGRPNAIAKELGISRATFYRRVSELILRHDRPTQSLMQVIAAEELDELTEITTGLLYQVVDAEEVDPLAAARLISEARQLNQSKRALFSVDGGASEPEEPGETEAGDDDWEAGEFPDQPESDE